MSQNLSHSQQRSKVTWSSQINPYEENTRALRMAQQSIVRNTDINLQNTFSDRESKIVKRATKLIEMARRAQPSSNGEKNTTNVAEVILNGLTIEEQKYAQFDSDSSHSSQEETSVEVTRQQVEDMVVSVSKQPQMGKITFISKIVRSPNVKQFFRVVKIKGVGKDMPQVYQIRTMGNFSLYEIQTNSFLNKFKIELMVDNKTITKSRDLSFSPRHILLELELSYNFQNKTPLKINLLEGLLASCVLEGDRLADQIIQLNGKRQFKSKLFNDKVQLHIDEQTKKFIKQNKNTVSLLKLLKLLIEEDDFIFGKPSKLITHSSYKILVQLFLQQILKFKPTSGRQDRQELNAAESLRLGELFIHFVCLAQLNTKGISIAGMQKQVYQKVEEFINFSFQNQQLKTYHNFIQLCIQKKLPIFPQSYDTIKDNVTNYSLSSSEAILIHFENMYYNVSVKHKKQAELLFIDIFEEKKFQNGNIYEKQLPVILKLADLLFKQFDVNSLSMKNFTAFFKIYCNFKENTHLTFIVRQESIKQKIQAYIKQLKNKIDSTAKQNDKIIGINLVQLYFITSKDSELIQSEQQFKTIVAHLMEKIKEPITYQNVVKLYFQIFKRGQRIFHVDFVKGITSNLISTLSRWTADRSLNILNKYFRQDYLSNQELELTCNQHLLKPIIAKLIPDNVNRNWLENMKNNHQSWSHSFKYQNHFNQQILQKMVRVTQKAFGQNNLQKGNYLSTIKTFINNNIDEQEKRNALLVIIQQDMILLQESHVWSYFTEKRGYLRILQKILKRDEEAAQTLLDSLKDIREQLSKKSVSFNKIQRIKSMKANEWHNFTLLTSEYQIPTLVDKIFEQGNLYLSNLKKWQNFTRELGVTYNSPDYQGLCVKLQQLSRNYIEVSIKDQTKPEVFLQFNEQILSCYRLKPFFSSQNVEKQPIVNIIKLCKQSLVKLLQKVQLLYVDYENGSLTTNNFYYFHPNKKEIKQFRNILTLTKRDINPESLENIINIYSIIADTQEHYKLFDALVKIQKQKFGVQTQEFNQYLSICLQIKQKKPIKVKQVQAKLSEALKKLSELKLNLKENKNILQIFALLAQNNSKIVLFKQIESSLKDLKDEINQSGGEVTYEQIQQCEIMLQFLKEVYEPQVKVNFSQFISAIFAFIVNKQKINKQFKLSLSLLTAFSVIKQLTQEKANMEDKNRSAVKFIDEVVQKVKFQFVLDALNKDKIVSLTTIYPSGEAKTVEQRQIFINKEKAIMMSVTLDEKQNRQRKAELFKFLQIVKVYELLKQQELRLTQQGLRQFQNKPVTLEINHSSLGNAKEFIEHRHKQLQQWRKSIKRLYEKNYKATHLQGKKVKQFYDFITTPNITEIPSSFTIINQKIEIHQQIIKNLNKHPAQNKYKQLSILSSYFELLKQKLGEKKAEDHNDNFLHFKLMASNDIDFIKGIEEIGSQRIKNLKFEEVLICTKQTSRPQIKSFIERALRNPDAEYVIIGCANLDRRKQQLIVDEIKLFKEQNAKNDFKLKLCLVDNSQISLLYKFLIEQLGKSPQKKENNAVISKVYEQKLKKQCQRVKIVYSSMAGIGKTTFIKNDSKNTYQCTEQYYLPLSGIMAVPSESGQNNSLVTINQTEKFLWDRFQEIINYFKKCEKEKKKSCLVIQVYNIDQLRVIDKINKFFQSILFFKTYQYKNNTGSIPKDVPIYIELQNVSLPAFVRVEERYNNLPPQMKMVSFLREIRSVCGERIIKNISQFKVTDIQINNTDKELNYILYHLKLFKSGEINRVTVQPYQSYQITPITKQEGQALITEYFFSTFKPESPPSGYLWTYFRSLLLQASKNFSKSYFLLIPSIAENDAMLKAYNVQLHTQMKLKQTFRSQFYKIILNNSLQFIQRSVQPGNENANGAFNQTLSNLPFLIIPNIDGDSFSFIYNNSNNVPDVIKSLIVLQTPSLFQRVSNVAISKLFEEQNLANFEKKPQGKQWVERASQILANISGNRNYKIDVEKGYIVNIDNFFKMCLIVQRMRLNIPIVIMGEAGIGKTALLRHVVNHLYNHKFSVFNINAGLPLQSTKSKNQDRTNQSLSSIVETIKKEYEAIQLQNQAMPQIKNHKKLWVFFDEFNTLKQLGFFKEIIIDKRYLGKEQPHIKNVVMMAACNPHRKLQLTAQQRQGQHVNQQGQRLAFDVLPAPHSLMECMWNYGALTEYQYEKYISKMLVKVTYRSQKISRAILTVHSIIQKHTFVSSVSLRDIDRFRQLYSWFEKNLPRKLKVSPKAILGAYNDIEQRAFILACYFTYILRFEQYLRNLLQRQIQKMFAFKEGYLLAAKQTQEDDLCSRLSFQWDDPIAVNNSLKENIYSCFVCINTRLPLLIIGAPGCSKSLSLRILAKNLKERVQDDFLKTFKRMRQYPIQGSQNTTTEDIKNVFQKAYKDLQSKDRNSMKRDELKQISVIVFDEIGLAQKSKDNPLKVLHPYLQVSRQQNLEERVLSFIGISNSELDVSKMSRLLVLRRPPSKIQDLIFTAQSIALGFKYGNQVKVKYLVQKLAETYSKFLQVWRAKRNSYPLFFGLRDFYGLIKIFMGKLVEYEVDINDDDDKMIDCVGESVFENFHGWPETYKTFKSMFYEEINVATEIPNPSMKETLNSVLKMLDRESLRYPLVIVDDQESLCFVKWLIQKKYPKKSDYLEGSPFAQNKDYSLKLLGQICRYMQTEHILILSNLSEGVKTGLYDFFNKSFIVRSSNNSKYLRIRTQEGSLNQMQYLYNKKFNCIYLLLQSDLGKVQPPFLSRFQKFRFGLKQYREELAIDTLSKVNRFIANVQSICRNNKLEHFNKSNLFININETALESLVVASYETGGQQNAYKQALRRLIMNSGQYFFKIYKHFIEPNGDLPEIKEIMEEAMESKNNGAGERSLIIRFTNDKHYTKKFTDKSIIAAEFVTFKKQADFDEQLSRFFKSSTKKTLYISLNVLTESIYLNYVASQIEKASKRAQAQNQKLEQKKIRLLYIFDRQKQNQRNQEKYKQIAITHFTQYKQQFDDGRLDQMKNISKKEVFTYAIKIQTLFEYTHQVFDFSFDCQENSLKAQDLFNKLSKKLYYKKEGLLSKQAEDLALMLEPNLEMGEQVIKEMLVDKQITKVYKNYREAFTKYFADRKLLGAIAVFFMYLFKNQSFMAYSSDELIEFYEEIVGCKFEYGLSAAIRQVKNKANNNYHILINELIQNKKQFIANDYRTLKMTKRLPTVQKKFAVKINKPRLVPFSKPQCEMILNCNDKQVGWYIKQIYTHDEKEDKSKFTSAYQAYELAFNNKTRLISKKNLNLYSHCVNQDKDLKTMFFLDLLIDFCEKNGLKLKFLSVYYQIINQFFGGQIKQQKKNKNEKVEKTITFTKMSSILVGFEEIWVELFKIWQNLSEQGIPFNPEPQRMGTKQSLKKYFSAFCKYLENLMLGANITTTFKNPQRYNTVYINILFHLEKIQQILDILIPQKLKSTRTTLVFIEMFDPNKKASLIKSFMSFKSKIANISHYHDMLNYFDGLKEDASKQQQEKIIQFEANQLFYEWFKLQPNNQACLSLFMEKCNDENFAHNSVATINLFLASSYNNFRDVQNCFMKYRSGRQNELSVHLNKLGEHAKQKNYRNNLAILITNIFMQKLTIAFRDSNFIKQQDRTFSSILDRIINSEQNGISTLFAFAYIKLYLKQYIQKLCNNHKSKEMSKIDEKISLQNVFCKNLRFYCLKLLRTKYPIKQIKDEYIKKKRVKWIEPLTDIFYEQASRSIQVPSTKKIPIAQNINDTINKIIESQGGQVELFDTLIDQANNNPYNRYALFNFFMRYYYSMSYNQKIYKEKVIQKLNASREAYSAKIGKLQFQLILRYAQSKFDNRIKIEKSQDFKEDTFIFFNSLNWLLATKTTVSPFHSYFFKNTQLHSDFNAAFQNLFFPCGPQNDFIVNAQEIIKLTSNNNIGVYICSAQCDYIYCHLGCGWPAQPGICVMCEKPIGCIPGKSHTINRANEGGKRLISTKLVDGNSSFYVGSLSSLANYWQMQRKYIEAEINRMKRSSVVTIGQRRIKLTGFQMQKTRRISNLSFSVFRQNIHSILYCLLGLGGFTQQQSIAVFKGKNINQAQQFLFQQHQQDLDYIKKAVGIDAKIYGWMFGIHKVMYSKLIQFQQEFSRFVVKIKQDSQELARNLQLDVHSKKVNANYAVLYADMAAALRSGLTTKQIENTNDMTASNSFTRDFLVSIMQSYIKQYTTQDKFALSAQNAELQGKMQFPKDRVLTQDQINEGQFQLARIFKIPDKQIQYNEIVINYQLSIRENYPFLDYILKNSQSITDMYDFYNVIAFSNELAKEIQNNYERKDAERSIKSITEQLSVKKQYKLHEMLRNPQLTIDSWNRLAKKMDVLQTQCTVVGKMDTYTLQTPIKAFLVQSITKQNLFGLTITSLFHNFAKMHNQLVAILNARKNQIPQYKCLNLYNQQKKIHPQSIQQSEVFVITEKELIEKLYQNSISSINYGKNFVFNNFDTYQHYFVMKLLGKCQIISDFKKFKNICYNGQAFAQTSQSSNTLTEVRQYFYEQLTRQQVHQVQGFIRSQGDRGKIEQYVIKLRGQLEKIMIAIRNLNGIILQAKNLGQFVAILKMDQITYQLKSETFGKFQVSKIVHFYQILELELKPSVIDKLPERYKEPINEQTQRQLRELLNQLPLQSQYSVTLSQFGYALYRFIARILLGGVQQNDKKLMEFLPYRNDFWPKDFEEYKLESIMNNEAMKNLTFAYAGHLFEIVERMIQNKLGGSQI